MKKNIFSTLIAVIALFITLFFIAATKSTHQDFPNNEIKNGDIIFNSPNTRQCKAVKLATKSDYTHCGIIYEEKGNLFVYEAVQPVKITPLKNWINNGQNKHYVIKRLKNADKILTSEVIAKMKKYGSQFKGKNYDIYFSWSDENLYCSELVWKIYKEGAGIEVGKLAKLKDFDLTSQEVKQIMKERYGNTIPFDETVISPSNIYESDLLMTVKSN